MATTIDSRPDAVGGDHKLTALVTSATRDLSALVHDEIALAKAELRRDVKQAATGGGLCAMIGMLWLKRIRGVDATKRTANKSLAVLKRAAR